MCKCSFATCPFQFALEHQVPPNSAASVLCFHQKMLSPATSKNKIRKTDMQLSRKNYSYSRLSNQPQCATSWTSKYQGKLEPKIALLCFVSPLTQLV